MFKIFLNSKTPIEILTALNKKNAISHLKQTEEQNSYKIHDHCPTNATKPFAKYVSTNTRAQLPTETRNVHFGYCIWHCSLWYPSVRVQIKLSGETTGKVQKSCTPTHPYLPPTVTWNIKLETLRWWKWLKQNKTSCQNVPIIRSGA